jgi:hypothetical protein
LSQCFPRLDQPFHHFVQRPPKTRELVRRRVVPLIVQVRFAIAVLGAFGRAQHLPLVLDNPGIRRFPRQFPRWSPLGKPHANLARIARPKFERGDAEHCLVDDAKEPIDLVVSR